MDSGRRAAELAGSPRILLKCGLQDAPDQRRRAPHCRRLAVLAPGEASLPLVREAWQWVDAAQLNYWDALIVAAAQRAGARYLLWEDFQEERTFGEVEVLNPFLHSPREFVWSDVRNGEGS